MDRSLIADLLSVIRSGIDVPAERYTWRSIADGYGILRNHLMKVVARLGQLGYLRTVRGNGGGIRLAKDPIEISIGRVVRSTEEGASVVPCLQPGGQNCRIAGACVLKQALGEAMEAFYRVLDGYTVSDLLRPRSNLLHLLRIDAPAQAPGVVH